MMKPTLNSVACRLARNRALWLSIRKLAALPDSLSA